MNRNIFANFADNKSTETITMDKVPVLWVDDEIDLLKPHILFLQEKGYDIDTATNGEDALDKINKNSYAIVLLDDNRKKTRTELEELQSKINAVSKEIGQLMAKGDKATAE